MNIVTLTEQFKREHLLVDSRYGMLSSGAHRDLSPTPDLLRNDFQRDRDRIIHSKAFRRLSHKTQVFLAPEGDHFRTRLTHTLEVSQIARTIARALSLNEDLTEAIALGHDLGHTPFGHAGEEALSECLADFYTFSDFIDSPVFMHNIQSLRVVENIENGGKGLNLTREVRNGIVCHTGSIPSDTYEGQIVAIADRIAYVNHDIDDAIRAGLLVEDDLPASVHELLGYTSTDRITALVNDLVKTSGQENRIHMSESVWETMTLLRTFLFERVYESERVLEEKRKAILMITELFYFFLENPDKIPQEYCVISSGDPVRAVVDYIAGMTDRYAIDTFEKLFIPSATRSK